MAEAASRTAQDMEAYESADGGLPTNPMASSSSTSIPKAKAAPVPTRRPNIPKAVAKPSRHSMNANNARKWGPHFHLLVPALLHSVVVACTGSSGILQTTSHSGEAALSDLQARCVTGWPFRRRMVEGVTASWARALLGGSLDLVSTSEVISTLIGVISSFPHSYLIYDFTYLLRPMILQVA